MEPSATGKTFQKAASTDIENSLAQNRMSHLPHPLDDLDPPEPPRRDRFAGVKAYKPLLKPCVYTAIISAAIVAISSVTASNAPPASFLENAATFVSRGAAVTMLVACGLILVAFRINSFMESPSLSLKASPLRGNGLAWLWATGIATIVALWLLAWLTPELLGATGFLILGNTGTILLGLITVIAIHHRGYVRAFAIGVLVPHLFQRSGIAMWSFAVEFDGGYGMNLNAAYYQLGKDWTVAILSGLIAASYVYLIELKTPSSSGDSDSKVS